VGRLSARWPRRAGRQRREPSGPAERRLERAGAEDQDQLGHSNIRMTQDRYLGRRLTDRRTAEVLDHLFDDEDPESKGTQKGLRLIEPLVVRGRMGRSVGVSCPKSVP